MSRKYFGTDGIRGEFGGSLINPAFFRRIGYALGRYLEESGGSRSNKVVIGRDTRASGEELENAICEGLCNFNIELLRTGELPTPALAFAVIDSRASLGIVITASHNLATDNGVKLFCDKGLKLDNALEERLESLIDASPESESNPDGFSAGDFDGVDRYIDFVSSLFPIGCLRGRTIVADTANGSAVYTTPVVLRNLGANLITLGDSPDGANINAGVGSEHPQLLAKRVVAEEASLGIAHDGDGDRVLFCDEKGNIVSGEAILALLGLHALKTGKLANKTLVTTVISNLGLDQAMEAAGGRVDRVDVGDRYVIQKMAESGCNFGGESSGHFIFGDHLKTADGLLSALKVIEIMKQSGLPLSQLRKCMQTLPQATANMAVSEKFPLSELPQLQETICRLENALPGRGRILVRYSGTELKIRLLVEAEMESAVESTMEALKIVVSDQLSAVS